MSFRTAHGDRELAVFADFMQRSGLPIDPLSVKKCDGPDIRCTHAVEGPIAFELSEVCAEDLAKLTANPASFEKRFTWSSDPSEKVLRNKLKKNYVADCPIELLLYTNGRVITPDETIVATLRPVLECRNGVFRRVWLLGEADVYEIPGIQHQLEDRGFPGCR